MNISDMVVEIFILLVTNATFWRRDASPEWCGLTVVYLFNVVLYVILIGKIQFTEAALDDFIVAVLFENVRPQTIQRKRLATQLTLDLFSVIGYHVLVQVLHLFST